MINEVKGRIVISVAGHPRIFLNLTFILIKGLKQTVDLLD